MLRVKSTASLYASSNPFPNQPIAPSNSKGTPSLSSSLPLPEKTGFQKDKTKPKRKAVDLLPVLDSHSPSYMDRRRATAKIRKLFLKPVHSFRAQAAKKDQPETQEPDEHGEIHCNQRTWGVHFDAGKGPRVYPKSGPGIYTFRGRQLEKTFNSFLALETPMKFEEFLAKRKAACMKN
jgi:hypothetical protein